LSILLEQLALETTRKCNLHCSHCMRGDKQDLNLDFDIIDTIFNNKEITGIKTICFSGGEPTLNPDVIVYTINKIIKEKLNVGRILLTTNGQIYNQKIIDALNSFNEYRNNFLIETAKNEPNKMKQRKIMENLNNNVIISFSQDQFHKKVERDIKLQYFKNAKGLQFDVTTTMEQAEIYKTGYANVGKKFNYQLQPVRYYQESDYYVVPDLLYITANGDVTSEGMGQYTDMDIHNFGNVEDITIKDILINYGYPTYGSKEIISDSNKNLTKLKK